MNVAVIGSNGFIGRNLIDKLSKDASINLFLFGRSDLSRNNNFPYHKLDLTNSKEIDKHFNKINLIYYLASSTIPSDSWDSPTKEISENLIPFINFLDVITRIGIKKIIFTSSAGTIYGNSTKYLSENAIKKPKNPYGINKLAMEYFLHYYDVKFGLKNYIFRISNIYGEGQNTKNGLGIINTYLEKIISKSNLDLYGDGNNVRNYVYIKDVATILSITIQKNFKSSKTYNLCSDDTLSINDVLNKLKKITNTDFNINYLPTRKSDISAIFLNNKKLKKKFNFNFTPLNIGLLNTYNYLLNKKR